MKILPNLNPLRFFLASFVIIFHIPKLSKNQGLPFFDDLPIFHKGVEAVYMFFVLSGFLIIRLIYMEKIRDAFSIKYFYMRRVLRILPLYYLIVIFGFAFYHALLPILNIPFPINYDLTEGLLMTFFFIPNIFATYEPGGILEILWSIGVEEQFYLLIGPILLFLNKKRILEILIYIFSLYMIVFHLSSFEFLSKYSFVYFFMIAGGIMAILEEKNKLNLLKKYKIISIAIVIATFLFFFTDLFEIKNEFLNNIFICTLFSLFIYSVSFVNFGVQLKNKTLDYLGNISYGIYMYHVIALNAVVFIFLQITNEFRVSKALIVLLINIFTFSLTILLSHFSYKYYEMYFLNFKKKFRT